MLGRGGEGRLAGEEGGFCALHGIAPILVPGETQDILGRQASLTNR